MITVSSDGSSAISAVKKSGFVSLETIRLSSASAYPKLKRRTMMKWMKKLEVASTAQMWIVTSAVSPSRSQRILAYKLIPASRI